VRKFTIDEAERCLPKVRQLVRRAQRLQDKIAYVLETNDAVAEMSSEGGFHFFMTEQVRVNREFHRLYHQFYDALLKIQEMGVIIRDLDEGMVDFPLRASKEMFLCWQLGEERIDFWRDASMCFDDRRPIIDVDAVISRVK